jgi:hypothetical protein
MKINKIAIHTISYIISFVICYIILQYGLDLANFILENKIVIKEYYKDHYIKTFFYEMILITIYIFISEKVTHSLHIVDNAQKLLFLTAIIVLISSAGMLFFNYFRNNELFLSKWFKNLGWKYILYEIILVGTIYHVYNIIVDKLYKTYMK